MVVEEGPAKMSGVEEREKEKKEEEEVAGGLGTRNSWPKLEDSW